MAPTITAIVSRDQTAASKPVSDSSELASNLEIHLDGVERTARRSPLHLKLDFRTHGAPSGHTAVWSRYGQQTLDWPGGRQDVSGATVLDQGPMAEGVADLLASQDAPHGIDQRFTIFLRLPNAALDLHNRGLQRYTLNATFQIAKPHVIAIGPAIPGTTLRRNGYCARVVESTIAEQALKFLTVETGPAILPSMFFPDRASRSQTRPYETIQLFLSGPDGIVVDAFPIRRTLQHTYLRIAGVQVAWRSTWYPLPDDLPNNSLNASTDGWNLGALYVEPVLTVQRAVTIDPFPLPSD